MIKKLLKIFLVLVVILWAILQIANYVVVFKVSNWIQQWNPEKLEISIARVKKAGGLFGLGIGLEGVNVVLPKQETLHVKTVSVEMPLWWPPKCRIRIESEPLLSGDVAVSFQEWQVRHLKGQFFDFSFDVVGTIDRVAETGELSVWTKGLKTFVHQLTDVPAWLDLILTDGEQQLTLKPQNGYLTFYGLPLMKL